MPILTLQEYKDRKGISSPNQDAVLAPLISSVNQIIETYCGRTFDPTTTVDLLTLGNDYTLMLTTLPVSSITSIEYGSSYGTYDNTYPATGFYLEKGMGLVELLDTSVTPPTHKRAFKVTYSSGYTSIPEDIKLCAVELTTHYKDREFKKTMQSSSGESVEFESGKLIPMQVKLILDNYRKL